RRSRRTGGSWSHREPQRSIRKRAGYPKARNSGRAGPGPDTIRGRQFSSTLYYSTPRLFRSCAGLGMAQISAGSDAVADELFQLLHVGKAPGGGAGPDFEAIDTGGEDAARAWDQRHFTQFVGEGGEEFLRHPCGAQQPAALGAVLDLEARRAR